MVAYSSSLGRKVIHYIWPSRDVDGPMNDTGHTAQPRTWCRIAVCRRGHDNDAGYLPVHRHTFCNTIDRFSPAPPSTPALDGRILRLQPVCVWTRVVVAYGVWGGVWVGKFRPIRLCVAWVKMVILLSRQQVVALVRVRTVQLEVQAVNRGTILLLLQCRVICVPFVKTPSPLFHHRQSVSRIP